MNRCPPDETLLGLLAIQPQHGYQLLDCFRDASRLGSVWTLGASQIYAVLKRLERETLIAGEPHASPDAPPRVEYALTPAGRQRLECWLFEPKPAASIDQVRVEFLTRLYIARELNRPTTPIVRRQQDACLQERERLLAERGRASAGIEWLSREFALAQLDALLQWIDRCELTPHLEGDEQS